MSLLVLRVLILTVIIYVSIKPKLGNELQNKDYDRPSINYHRPSKLFKLGNKEDADEFREKILNSKNIDESNQTFSMTSFEEEPLCGYEACPTVKKGMVNVHLIPHTHLDVGWLNTLDRYYRGYENAKNIEAFGVRKIIDSVITQLLKDRSRKFILAETVYLWMWWNDNNVTKRNILKKIVNSGQLEIVGGGWSMNDEAVTHYQPTIDQFTWGFRKLDEMLGECGRPRVGWQIDPFGHSRETASIMAQLGFDGLFLGRIHYQDLNERRISRSMEMIWRGSPSNLGNYADILTSILFDGYTTPEQFCFDVYCYAFINDEKRSSGYNAKNMNMKFKLFAKKISSHYLSKNILVPMGRDFGYVMAETWYDNMDKLIRSINEDQARGGKLNLIYSTPSCYLKALNEENITLPIKTDDFFPYASEPGAYWSGFYTSRSTLKYFERKANNFLQVCKQLFVLSNLNPEYERHLDSLRGAMGILQHHDAITGTSTETVASDYAYLLSKGIHDCENVTNAALRKLIKKSPKNQSTDKIKISTCPLMNISECDVTEKSKTFLVTIYNPLSCLVSPYIRIPISGENPSYYTILSPKGNRIPAQIVPISSATRSIPGRVGKAKHELVFKVFSIPPFGFHTYYVTQEDSKSNDHFQFSRQLKLDDINEIGNPNKLQLTMNQEGDINKITVNGRDYRFTQTFGYYESSIGSVNPKKHPSGIYVFSPSVYEKFINKVENLNIYKGPIVHEIHKKFNHWLTQVTRIYNNADHIEFEWLVGPIPIDDGSGKEIITRYSFTEINVNGIFYTSSNGREILKRQIKHHSWNFAQIDEPISKNYYPITSKIMIKDNITQIAILTDRPQGGTLQKEDNEIELMIHRRVLKDDLLGVGEGLNETAFGVGLVAKGSHYLTIGDVEKQNAVERFLAKQVYLQPWIFLSPLEGITFAEWIDTYTMKYSGLNKIPLKNIHILTLEPWKEKSILLRLEHSFEKEEDQEFSRPVFVDLQNLFLPFKIVSIQEMTLGANLPLAKMKRMQWKPSFNNNYSFKSIDLQNTSELLLIPMQIRTFIINIDYTQFN